MALTLEQKLKLIESDGWIGLGYQFLRSTSGDARVEIERLRDALARVQNEQCGACRAKDDFGLRAALEQ